MTGFANRPLDRRLVLGVFGVLAILAGIIGGNGMLRVWQMRRELETLERDIVQLRAQTQKLSQTVDRLRGDPAYIEKLAREDLGYVRQGETVLKFPSQSNGSSQSSSPSQSNTPSQLNTPSQSK